MRRLFAMIIVSALLLTGCSSEMGSEETAGPGRSSMEGVIDETETTEAEENDTQEMETDDPIVKEAMVSALWVKSLQVLEMQASQSDEENCWERTYEVETHLKKFNLSAYKYILRVIYPERKMSVVTFHWPDYVKDISEYYEQAVEYLDMNFDGDSEYNAQSSWITNARRESMLKVSGEIRNEMYEQSNLFLDNLYPYTYYALWGSVLKVAGEQHLENKGSILGKFSGQAYMMNFDFDTLTGTFWICLDEAEPVQVSMRFHNRDCYAYFLEINDVVWDETVPDSAWLGLKFDLETSKMR